MKRTIRSLQHGYTLIEVMFVVVIITIVTGLSFVTLTSIREQSYITKAGKLQNELKVAAEIYRKDMGFYPPDVNRGWDPGFSSSEPTNPDGQGSAGTDCSHCPEDWEDIIADQWKGPYIKQWPNLTPWGGKYDYNYWGEDVDRYGCFIEAGVYIGVQGDYDNNNQILESSEVRMLEQGLDGDNCTNGEAQMPLWTISE